MIPPVVESDYLSRMAGDDGLVVADVRWYLDGRSGFDAYRAGHIPGAVFVDLERWLAAPTSAGHGRHPLPDPRVFAEGMSSLGVGDGSVVIAYDDAGGVIAARLVWMLRATGHDAALLDGGLQAYGGPLATAYAELTPARFTPTDWPGDRLASIDEAQSPANVVIDARAPERYRGDQEPVDPRPGHIPGARNVPCRDNLAPDGRFRPAAALRARFEAAGAAAVSGTAVSGTAVSNVVSYCGSGVTACHNLLALEWAGLGIGRLYPGSWSQYSADPNRSAATGDN